MKGRVGLFALLLVTSCSARPSGSGTQPRGLSFGTVRLLFAGDVMLGRGVAGLASEDPEGLFADVRFEVSQSDLAVANLESPLTTRPHVTTNPNALEADPASARLLVDAGFDAMSVANNHSGDAGPGGVADTLDSLDSAGLLPVGGASSANAAFTPVIVEVKGIRVALLSFDVTKQGLRATDDAAGVAWWDEARVRASVAEARADADIVTVGIHGGAEYVRGADPYVSELARTLASWDVDVVWGQGPHVIQPTRVVDPDGDGRPTVIVASLGNLLFDQHLPGTRRGAMLEIVAGRDGVVAYGVGTTQHRDGRVHFRGWRAPKGGAVSIDGDWFGLVGAPAVAANVEPNALPDRAGWDFVDATVGDVTGDGVPEVVAAFRRPFAPTDVNASLPRSSLVDAQGRSAHVGLFRPDDLGSIWVAGTLTRPVGAVAACDGWLAVAYTGLNDPAVVATGAWRWGGFGFLTSPDLPGPGVPSCADVDLDGRLDPIVIERSSP